MYAITLIQAASSYPEAVILFWLLDHKAEFFGPSYKRIVKWRKTVIENHIWYDKMLRLQKFGQTRGWSKDDTLNNIFYPKSTPNQDKNR